ncbi:MAG: hypothetical protein LQ341_003281 [Variospora aurantia]|nr:MAG: hypothetical protein LQ341_003281 [Variospora aurantia]
MDAEEDDDIYASGTANSAPNATNTSGTNAFPSQATDVQKPADLEEGEEEDEEEEEEESDSDIDIITERKDEPKSEPAPCDVLPLPPDHTSLKPPRSPAIKVETTGKATPPTKPGSSYPAIRTSSIDVDAKPIHGPSGKHITEVDMDADFTEDEKPWRRPGTDMTDYFNYGFDEFTWASYCLKQDTLRKEVADTKKQMEDMQNFMNVPGGMPSMPGMPPATGAQAGMPPMPSMEGIPPELQQMLQQMISQGMDPTQISPEMMMQMMGGQGGAGNQGQGQNYGGGQNFGQQNQNQGYGYGGGVGGRGGRGGGGRRW